MLDRAAKEVSDEALSAVLGPGYGIFAGNQLQIARLRFSPERARWVATEHWHPEQKGWHELEGHYLLEVPYADHRELLMDILKHGRHCQVLGPESLRAVVAEEIRQLVDVYLYD